MHARLVYPATQAEALARAAIAAGAVVAIGFGLALFAFVNRRQMPFGAARFGTSMEAARQGLTGKLGIVLGLLGGTTIRSDEPAHILVVGPSRSGKGTGFVLPNGYLWQGSAVFFDPKRENFEALANHCRPWATRCSCSPPAPTTGSRTSGPDKQGGRRPGLSPLRAAGL